MHIDFVIFDYDHNQELIKSFFIVHCLRYATHTHTHTHSTPEPYCFIHTCSECKVFACSKLFPTCNNLKFKQQRFQIISWNVHVNTSLKVLCNLQSAEMLECTETNGVLKMQLVICMVNVNYNSAQCSADEQPMSSVHSQCRIHSINFTVIILFHFNLFHLFLFFVVVWGYKNRFVIKSNATIMYFVLNDWINRWIIWKSTHT